MHAEVTLERAGRVAGSVSVRAYEAHESEKWEGFVARCRDATFFHRIGWREIIEEIIECGHFDLNLAGRGRIGRPHRAIDQMRQAC